MTMLIEKEIYYVFDSVTFAIDVRQARLARHMTQEQVANEMGYDSANFITRIENPRYKDNFKMEDYVRLCNILNLRPQYYWDTQS